MNWSKGVLRMSVVTSRMALIGARVEGNAGFDVTGGIGRMTVEWAAEGG
jgi:hypothetical protein